MRPEQRVGAAVGDDVRLQSQGICFQRNVERDPVLDRKLLEV